jgi:phosphomannomutase
MYDAQRAKQDVGQSRMSVKFGTSGLRGLSVDLLGQPTTVYVSAFAKHLLQIQAIKEGDTIFVGRDFRPSSPTISETAMAALEHAGLHPVDCGTVPTPALAFHAIRNNAAAIMITGSHIPADRNGIKFYRPDGEIDKEDETQIIAHATSLQSIKIDPTQTNPRPIVQTDVEKAFIARNMAILPKNALHGLKVGVYEHSTVARDLFVEVLNNFGAEVVRLGRSGDFIPVDTEAVSADTITQLKAWAATHKVDAIISADGDGDRPLVADENGAPVRGDLLGLITAQFLSARVMVTPVTSNSSLESLSGGTVVRTRVGSPYVISAMQTAAMESAKGIMGFEANGGVLTNSDFEINGHNLTALPTRDSFLPILATLYWIIKSAKPLSQLIAESGLALALSDRVENFPIEHAQLLMSNLRGSSDYLGEFLRNIGSVVRTSEIDGLRVTLHNKNIIHFRASGNAPEMRCYVEAATLSEAQELLAKGLAALDNFKRAAS